MLFIIHAQEHNLKHPSVVVHQQHSTPELSYQLSVFIVVFAFLEH